MDAAPVQAPLVVGFSIMALTNLAIEAALGKMPATLVRRLIPGEIRKSLA
jgi:hypothetical protein